MSRRSRGLFCVQQQRAYSVALREAGKWHYSHVPYKINNAHFPTGSMVRKAVEAGIYRLNASDINIVLEPVEHAPHFIEFQSAEDSCSSHIGRQHAVGKQIVSCAVALPTYNSNSVIHEVLHALGYLHEQSRPDRGHFVEIVDDNIQPGAEHNFRVYKPASVHMFGRYDCASIMHYGAKAFGKINAAGKKETTIKILDPVKCKAIGLHTLSPSDIAGINSLYSPLSTPGISESTLLSESWEEGEDGWSGVWLRRGKSRIFDAYWTKGSEVERAILKVSINPRTRAVRVHRTNTFYNKGPRFGVGWYEGTIDSSGMITGRYKCEWSKILPWKAQTGLSLADALDLFEGNQEENTSDSTFSFK